VIAGLGAWGGYIWWHGPTLSLNLTAAKRTAVLRYAVMTVWPADGGSQTSRHVGCATNLLGVQRTGPNDAQTVYTFLGCTQCPRQRTAALFPMAFYLHGSTVTGASLRRVGTTIPATRPLRRRSHDRFAALPTKAHLPTPDNYCASRMPAVDAQPARCRSTDHWHVGSATRFQCGSEGRMPTRS
jgi:hypothetical protein